MIDTKLIHVDGLPGSGKSTTAQWIALELQKRTVDNVLPQRFHPMIFHYKMVLGGLLLRLQQDIHEILGRIARGEFDEESLLEVQSSARLKLLLKLPELYEDYSLQEGAYFLYNALNRPLRVCGVTPRESYPGGAPFRVLDSERGEVLRIVEEQEVDQNSREQVEIWRAAQYFNPVDIVCGLRDFLGKPFQLLDFQDPDASIIVSRWHDGGRVKLLELPGLWNGGMAHWNTVFVEMPRTTLHPVKNVMDLLAWQRRP